jgi:hypothetical protein
MLHFSVYNAPLFCLGSFPSSTFWCLAIRSTEHFLEGRFSRLAILRPSAGLAFPIRPKPVDRLVVFDLRSIWTTMSTPPRATDPDSAVIVQSV